MKISVSHENRNFRSIFASTAIIFAILTFPDTTFDGRDTTLRDMQVAQVASFCCTPRGQCPLNYPQPPGTACYCGSPYGPIAGSACY